MSQSAPPSKLDEAQKKDCLTCRIIGSGALGAVGIYALNQSRAHQPGSVVGKRIMAGVGVCFLVGSVIRWSSTAPRSQDTPVPLSV